VVTQPSGAARLRAARRIAVIGNGGGGKTTLSRALGAALALPVHHVDSVQFLPGWRVRDRAETDRELDRLAAGERWILDGFGGHACIARRLAAADAVVFVDLPLVQHCLWALRRQRWAGRRPRPELPPNCPESSLRHTLELLRTLWRVHRTYRPWFTACVAALEPRRVVHVRSRAEMRALQRAFAPAQDERMERAR
jgi:adenylate kinase family enzyme